MEVSTGRRRYLGRVVGARHRRRRANVQGWVQGHDGYAITAVIAVEGARRLVADAAKPGVLAPAQAFDPVDFLDFLAPYGVGWSIQDS